MRTNEEIKANLNHVIEHERGGKKKLYIEMLNAELSGAITDGIQPS